MNRIASRLLNLLLCAPLLGPMSLPGSAVMHPENRVGGAAAFSSKFASESSLQIAELHRGYEPSNYDVTSGVRNYLYAHNDPVNNIDPSGQFSLAGSLSTIGNISRLSLQVGIRVGKAYNTADTAFTAYELIQELHAIYEGEAGGTEVVAQLGKDLLFQLLTRKALGVIGGAATTAQKATKRQLKDYLEKQKRRAGTFSKRGVPFKSNGFPNFKDFLYQGGKGKNTVTIKLTGSRTDDYREANRLAGFGNTARSHPSTHVWHHNETIGVMELVEKKAHTSVAPSPGGVKLWELLTGIKYIK